MKGRVIELFQRIAARRFLQPLWRAVYKTALFGLNVSGGADVHASGEFRVLRELARNRRTGGGAMVFDVGANVGTYAKAVLEVFGDKTTIHCFEPSEHTFGLLRQALGGDPRVVLHRYGLGDREETVRLHYDTPASGLATLYRESLAHHDTHLDTSEAIELKTLDGVCSTHTIDYIDLLKMDVEGHEFKVLLGARTMLERRAIGAIQFEMGPGSISARTYLRDFYELLSPHYDLFRIVKDGLAPLQRYSEEHEHFLVTNYLAIRRDYTDIL